MLDKRLKWAIFFVTLALAVLPISGIILDVMRPTPGDVAGNRDHGERSMPTASLPPEDMVFIPAGEFLRGYDGGGFDEKPEGRVHLDSYWIDRYEVIYGAYMAFVAATGHPKPLTRYVRNYDKLTGLMQPVVNVTWNDAQSYCEYRGARLPSEAEWEKAARGIQGFLYPWGNQDKPGAANTGNPDSFEFTAPVGSFPLDKSSYGIYDMDGNAMEWVADWYEEEAYKDTRPNPKGPETGELKVIRGASWETVGKETRLTIRLSGKAEVTEVGDIPLGFNFRRETVGFRCAKSDLKEHKTPSPKRS